MVSPARDISLQRFLDLTETAIIAGSGSGPERYAARTVFASLRRRAGVPSQPGPQQVPGCRFLDQAFGNIATGRQPIADLGQALSALAPRLAWTRRQNAETAGQVFYDGHANATIVGAGGLEERRDVWIGVTLMAPHLTYPQHSHPPEEVYVALTPGEWWNADMDWTAPGIGGLIYNRHDILHTMRSDGVPFLAIWCLPVD